MTSENSSSRKVIIKEMMDEMRQMRQSKIKKKKNGGDKQITAADRQDHYKLMETTDGMAPVCSAHSGTVVHLSHQTKSLGSSIIFPLQQARMLLQCFPKIEKKFGSCPVSLALTGIAQVLSNL